MQRLYPRSIKSIRQQYHRFSRFCLGYAFAQLEIKIFALKLLRNCSWELDRNQDLLIDWIPTLHPRSGLKIKLEPNEVITQYLSIF